MAVNRPDIVILTLEELYNIGTCSPFPNGIVGYLLEN